MSFLDLELDAEQFRRRSADAVKRGNPRWFWPEVAVEDWSATVAAIADIAADVLRTGRSALDLQGDPAAVSVAAFTTGMGPLLGHWLAEGRISVCASTAEVLRHHLAHNAKRMERLAGHAVEVIGRLTGCGIETTVLKGMHTAFAYFPTPATRPMSDIDILIDPAAEPAAAAVLRQLGFEHSRRPAYPERTWRKPEVQAAPKSLYFVHEDDQWSIDLHLTAAKRAAAAAPAVRFETAGAGDRAHSPLLPAARSLDHPALLMHLATHAGINLLSLTLLRLVELVLVIRRDTAEGSLSWAELHAAAERTGGLGPLYPALSLCERLAPGTVPDAVASACRERAPPGVVRLIESLTPATAHAVLRCSVEERFMWLPSPAAVARQILYDLLPLKRSMSELLPSYRMLAWRLLRRTVSR